jgi:hypothetical protein
VACMGVNRPVAQALACSGEPQLAVQSVPKSYLEAANHN